MSLQDSSTITVQLVHGSSTTTFTSPNLFTLQLPSYGFTADIDEIALKNLTIYYSWPNISAAKGNNSFSYIMNGVTYPVVMGDGIYSFNDLNAFLQQVMITNGHYLTDQYNVNQTFINFVVNPVLYCLSLTVTPVPTTLPDGWQNLASLALGSHFQLVVPNGMQTLLGFPAGLYPPVPQALYQINSDIPQITDCTSLNVLSNVVNSSSLSLSPNVLATLVVSNGQVPGSQMQFSPMNLDWTLMQKNTTFTYITVAIVDQLMRPVLVRDPSGFLAILNIRRRK